MNGETVYRNTIRGFATVVVSERWTPDGFRYRLARVWLAAEGAVPYRSSVDFESREGAVAAAVRWLGEKERGLFGV